MGQQIGGSHEKRCSYLFLESSLATTEEALPFCDKEWTQRRWGTRKKKSLQGGKKTTENSASRLELKFSAAFPGTPYVMTLAGESGEGWDNFHLKAPATVLTEIRGKQASSIPESYLSHPALFLQIFPIP